MSEVPVETTQQDERTVRVNLQLRQDVHKALRMWCLKRGVTLQEGLESIVNSAMMKPLRENLGEQNL
jgi:hypothetical protein